jgi:hypothetical protein
MFLYSKNICFLYPMITQRGSVLFLSYKRHFFLFRKKPKTIFSLHKETISFQVSKNWFDDKMATKKGKEEENLSLWKDKWSDTLNRANFLKICTMLRKKIVFQFR